MKNKTYKYIYIATFGQSCRTGYPYAIVSYSKKECIEKCKNANSNKFMPIEWIESLPKRVLVNKIFSIE
jgi:hypothetical protein